MDTSALTRGLATLFLAIGGIVLSLSASAVYVFTTIDYPGSTLTDVGGINNSGQIAGTTIVAGVQFAFVYSSGSYTPLPPAPGGLSIAAGGINDSGVVVGVAAPADASYGKLFILNGTSYQLAGVPGRTYTEGRSVNNAGLVTRHSYNLDASGFITDSSGFIYNPSTGVFTNITVPDSAIVIAHGNQCRGTGCRQRAGQNRPRRVDFLPARPAAQSRCLAKILLRPRVGRSGRQRRIGRPRGP